MTSFKQFTKDMNRDKNSYDRRLPWETYYWKLGSLITPTISFMQTYLKKHNFYVTGRAAGDFERLMTLIERCEQGLLSYDPCKLPELWRFVVDRGLMTMGGARRFNKAGIIAFLEAADTDLLFSKFLKLPAELRNGICEIYYISLGTLPARFHQPPLTLTNRQLRAECLPLFYNTCAFRISSVPTSIQTIQHNIIAEDWRYDTRTQAFLASISKDNLASIKNLVLVTIDVGSRASLAWTIDLRASDTAREVELEAYRPRPACYEFVPNTAKDVTAGLQEAVDEIRAREGGANLAKEDFQVFLGVIADM